MDARPIFILSLFNFVWMQTLFFVVFRHNLRLFLQLLDLGLFSPLQKYYRKQVDSLVTFENVAIILRATSLPFNQGTSPSLYN